MNQEPSRAFTPAAAIVAIILVVPATLAAGLLVVIYKWFLSGVLTTSWLPGIVNKIALLWFPSLLHGGIAGLLAMAGTRRLFKYADLNAVTYATSAVYVTLSVLIWTLNLRLYGVQEDTVSLAAQTIGLIAGLSEGRR